MICGCVGVPLAVRLCPDLTCVCLCLTDWFACCLQGQRDAEELVRSTKIQCDALRIKADEEYQTMVLGSEARLIAVSD